MSRARDEIWSQWCDLVNLSAGELSAWLDTRESHAVGHRPVGAESLGHAEGRRIAAITRKTREELSDEDWVHMRRTLGFIRRHLGSGGPAGNLRHSPWRYALMNRGHDPLKRGSLPVPPPPADIRPSRQRPS